MPGFRPGQPSALVNAVPRPYNPPVLSASARTRVQLAAFSAHRGLTSRRLRIASEREDRRNHQITAPRVRVITDDGTQLGVIRNPRCAGLAEEEGLDLVEVSPNAEPPVCKIMDYGKYLYQKDKAAHAAKKKQKQIQIKEIKFRPTTDDGDYQNQDAVDQARFLEEGDEGQNRRAFPWPRNGAPGTRHGDDDPPAR